MFLGWSFFIYLPILPDYIKTKEKERHHYKHRPVPVNSNHILFPLAILTEEYNNIREKRILKKEPTEYGEIITATIHPADTVHKKSESLFFWYGSKNFTFIHYSISQVKLQVGQGGDAEQIAEKFDEGKRQDNY